MRLNQLDKTYSQLGQAQIRRALQQNRDGYIFMLMGVPGRKMLWCMCSHQP
jgi:hypothetical protein